MRILVCSEESYKEVVDAKVINNKSPHPLFVKKCMFRYYDIQEVVDYKPNYLDPVFDGENFSDEVILKALMMFTITGDADGIFICTMLLSMPQEDRECILE